MHLSINRIIWIQSPTIYLLRLVDYSFGGNVVEAFRVFEEGANEAYKNAKHLRRTVDFALFSKHVVSIHSVLAVRWDGNGSFFFWKRPGQTREQPESIPKRRLSLRLFPQSRRHFAAFENRHFKRRICAPVWQLPVVWRGDRVCPRLLRSPADHRSVRYAGKWSLESPPLPLLYRLWNRFVHEIFINIFAGRAHFFCHDRSGILGLFCSIQRGASHSHHFNQQWWQYLWSNVWCSGIRLYLQSGLLE